MFPNSQPWISKQLQEILNKEKKRIFYIGSESEEIIRKVKRAIKLLS